MKLKKRDLKYSSFDQISKFWEEYANRLNETELSVYRMDIHGATILVTSSPDPSIVGLKGRVVKESTNAIILISEDNVLRQINKKHTIIELDTPQGNRYEINLGTMCFNPYLKPTRKNKQRAPLSLPY